PPALLPSITSRSFDPYPFFTRYSAHEMKSVNVVFLFIMRPASCHALPISPPPRMCATAVTTPRSAMLKMFELKNMSIGAPYDPYPYRYSASFPSSFVPFRYITEIGIFAPSAMLKMFELKNMSIGAPYDPYPYRYSASFPSSFVPFRYITEIGIFAPSA